MRNEYSISEFLKNGYSFILTKIFYNNARLIRRPFYIRGKSSLTMKNKLTTGYNCRLDLIGGGQKTLFIGENCEIGDYVHIVAREKVIIGDNCLFASKIFISDTNHGSYNDKFGHSSPLTTPNSRELLTDPVYIDDHVWVGENVCILPGVRIGKGSIIGANSVVNSSIPEYSIAVGSPAKVIKHYDFNEEKWLRS
jgi:acetyltransferase-like isoleucine patch superfamily enzyme